MNDDDKHVAVSNNEAEQRYEVRIGDDLAVLEYERQGSRIIFLHTEVPATLEGRGIASQLAHTALEEARSQKLTVVPACPFVATYIRHHPEYLSLLSATERKHFLEH